MRIFHSLCSTPTFPVLFSSLLDAARERASGLACVFCPLVFPLWSEGLFSDWVTPMGYAASAAIRTPCSYIQSACLSFSPQQPRSLSLAHFFISLSGTHSDCYFISLFSPEPKTKGAPTALCFCTQPLVLIGLSQENYILSNQWKR